MRRERTVVDKLFYAFIRLQLRSYLVNLVSAMRSY